MSQNTVIVTGINGFVGKHLASELNSRGIKVIGIGQDLNPHPDVAKLISNYMICDLTDVKQVEKLPLDSITAIISLAGLAKVGDSFAKPDLYKHVNVAVLSVLGERLLALGLATRVLAISTGAVYSPDQPMPLTESSNLITEGSPYAFSKIAMEQEAMRLQNLGLNSVVVRPFNHIGPGQEGGFLVPDLFARIQAAHKSNGVLLVGDLTTGRDYTDVRDVVRAYADLALAPKISQPIYNVCSGIARSGEEVLQTLTKIMGTPSEIIVDNQLFRPSDAPVLYGSNQRITTDTGWEPSIAFEQTIADYVASVSS